MIVVYFGITIIMIYSRFAGIRHNTHKIDTNKFTLFGITHTKSNHTQNNGVNFVALTVKKKLIAIEQEAYKVFVIMADCSCIIVAVAHCS